MEWWNFTVTSDLFFMLQNLAVHFKCLTLFCVFTMLIILFYDFFVISMMMLVFPPIWILSYAAAYLLTFPLGLNVQQSFIHSFLSYMHLSSICVTSLSLISPLFSQYSPWSPQWLFIGHFCALMESYCLSNTVHFFSPVYLLWSTFLLW